VKVAVVSDEIQTDNLRNMILEHYPCTSLLGGRMILKRSCATVWTYLVLARDRVKFRVLFVVGNEL
jgi:hypothetical protein